MSCQVNGCPESNNYHYNPICTPFHEFHGRVISCFDQLPERGKCKELALRAAIVAISPFAYLVLGVAYLLGLASNAFWENRHIAEIEKQKIEAETKKTEAEVMQYLPCPLIIQALGGAEKVKNLPRLEEEISNTEEMSHPVMLYQKNKHTGLYFRVIETSISKTGKLKTEDRVLGMGWNDHIHKWLAVDFNNPILANRNSVYNSPGEEMYIADRIQRLVSGKGIGVMETLPGITFILPEDKTPFKPKEEDSYLKGKDLDAYLNNTEAFCYEKVIIPGEREIVLA